LRERPASGVTLSFLDADGNEIKTFRSKPEGEELAKEEQRRKETGAAEEPWVPIEPGLNRFVWNMRYPDARNFPNAIYRSSGVTGPLAPPGAYQVRLTAGDRSWTQPLELRKDPRAAASDEDLRAQFALLLRIRDKLSETNDAIARIRKLRGQIESWEERSRGREGGEAIATAGQALKEGLASVEEELVQTRWKSSRDALTAPSKLNVKLATLLGVVGGADGPPTRQAEEVFASVSERVDAQLARLSELLEREVPRFNALVREQDLPALTVE
jgi:hypothetical protein